MAKRNKKGGWTGTPAGINAVKSGGGPQVDSWLTPKKKEKVPAGQLALRIVAFVLACVLLGSLTYQVIPKNMAEYWEVDDVSQQIDRVEITHYTDLGESRAEVLTEPDDVQAFYDALDQSKLKRLWFAGDESAPFTSAVQIYLQGEAEPAFDLCMVDERVYFIGIPTYDWYLEADAPLMEYLR